MPSRVSEPRRAALPDSPALADGAAEWWSAYVHVPFCARRCPYCDFAVVTPEEGAGPATRYVDAVVAEMAQTPTRSDRPGLRRPLDAVYVGGGTPSRLPATELHRLVDALRGSFGVADSAEITLEANPEDWTPSMAEALVGAGFTRVSFGAQSFEPTVLSYLGRAHTPEEAAAAVAVARHAGFESISLDLIYGSPPDTDWRDTVRRAIELQPDHVSTYALTVEGGTELFRSIAAGALAPDPDRQADAYELAGDELGAAGYVRYEVSNYAKPDHAVRYTMAVWAQAQYLAFGLGAHDHLLAGPPGAEPVGVRRRNVRRLEAYLEAVEAGRSPEAGRERIAGWQRELERLFLGIRRAAGVAAGVGGTALLASPQGRRLVEAGVLVAADDRLRVLRPLLTDAVSRAILDLPPSAASSRPELSVSPGDC